MLGIDVDPVKPPYMLPNCRFDLVDASQPWSFDQNFDFIHMRSKLIQRYLSYHLRTNHLPEEHIRGIYPGQDGLTYRHSGG